MIREEKVAGAEKKTDDKRFCRIKLFSTYHRHTICSLLSPETGGEMYSTKRQLGKDGSAYENMH
jgi:hypothetical protein